MKLYFMGVGGTAMGNAALLLRAAGHEVHGADTALYPPMSTVLADAGITVLAGYDAERLKALNPDVVVVGNAMSRGNPEVEWLLETRALTFLSLPETLNRFVLGQRQNIVICGTHGKTTTTALTSFLLRVNGGDPGFLIGGVPQDPPVGNHLGALDQPFVIEGDEYDSAFFDKRSKFIHYAPRVAVLNNLEFDHADIFRDVADIQRTFLHLTRIVPQKGFVVLNGDDPNLAALGPLAWTQVIRVGLGENNDARIANFTEAPGAVQFELRWKNEPWTAVRWSLSGLFNARNAAMAAVAAGLIRAGGAADPRGLDLAPLARFRGVKRRQEQRAVVGSLTVMEDFGHHPTALGETLRSFRARFPQAKLTAVFEPRSNTAGRKALQLDFQNALGVADEIYLGPVHRPGLIAEANRFNPAEVVGHLTAQGRFAEAFASNTALYDRLVEQTLPAAGRAERVITFFSNGSFDGIIPRYVAAALSR
jgi:UDP-N-acetylmuramate: L-alanyl-gamma-D-glutamyl-meso-diaminopimelate ligase